MYNEVLVFGQLIAIVVLSFFFFKIINRYEDKINSLENLINNNKDNIEKNKSVIEKCIQEKVENKELNLSQDILEKLK
jgi:hypothetical protein